MIDMHKKCQEFAGVGIVPLDSLSAPLVAEMQAAIRYQKQLLDEAQIAMRYFLQKNRNRFATETECKIVTSIARIANEHRTQVASDYDAFHDGRETYGCIDDPKTEVA